MAGRAAVGHGENVHTDYLYVQIFLYRLSVRTDFRVYHNKLQEVMKFTKFLKQYHERRGFAPTPRT